MEDHPPSTTHLPDAPSTGPRNRVLWASTWAFTALFAVWLMLGILGLQLKKEPALMLGAVVASRLGPGDIKLAVNARFEWLLAAAILAGALPRLIFGIWADRLGGRALMVSLLVFCAIPTYLLGRATSFEQLLACALGFGLAGNAFTVGIAWNSAWFPPSRKGLALGIFGAGNVGAAGTKLLVVLAPWSLTLVPADGYLGGLIPGGWRFVPTLYAAILLATAATLLVACPSPDRKPAAGRPLADLLAPLRFIQVWRFGLDYVVVFGAYVALSAWLPSYFESTYGVDLKTAALMAAVYIFPASLLRPLGGELSDRLGPMPVTLGVFLTMIAALIPLCLPTRLLDLGLGGVTALLFVVGAAMGIGKASVYKSVSDEFPDDVGAVGGLVGTIGALGGFLLPPALGSLARWTGNPQSAFISLLTLAVISLGWLSLGRSGLGATRKSRARSETLGATDKGASAADSA